MYQAKGSLNISDITGSKPKSLFGSRQSRKLEDAGSAVIDNTYMTAAGVKKPGEAKETVANLFGYGA